MKTLDFNRSYIWFVAVIILLGSCEEKLKDHRSMCSFSENTLEVISFDIPDNKLTELNNSEEINNFKSELSIIYDLDEVEFISEDVYALDDDYSLYYSMVKSEDCGKICLIGVQRIQDEKTIFYNANHHLVKEMRWMEVGKNLHIYVKTLLSEKKTIKRTYMIDFDFDLDGIRVSVDDGFSNWDEEIYPSPR